MTTTKSAHQNVVVVDGSNIATEGRSTPSLTQLNDAVMAFKDEFPDATITVVVDATFGHRIDRSEVKEFDAAVAHNELVAPPAGAIGRGDAFVLGIANKVGARILSNDSFQEFHADYPWLFDEGRLIGGKPVPYVGWVFVERLPVKGPTSRKAQRASREPKTVRRTASKEASKSMPVPTSPPPGVRRAAAAPVAAHAIAAPVPAASTPASGAAVNDLLTFLDFVEKHPVGSSVNGVVESYSSHGAYVRVGDLRGYVPLRLMSVPPPRSAREVMRVDDAVTLVVMNFAPGRRSVDLAVPAMAPGAEVVASPELEELADVVTTAPAKRKATAKKAPAKPAPTKKAAAKKKAAAAEPTVEEAPAEHAPARGGRRGRKKAAAPPPEPPTVADAGAAEAERPSRGRKKQAVAADVPAEPPAAPVEQAAKRRATKRAPAKAAAGANAAAPAKAAARKKQPPAEPALTPTPRKRGAKQVTAAVPEAPAPDGDQPASPARRSRGKQAVPAGAETTTL